MGDLIKRGNPAWQKGVVMNPDGRPRGMQALIKELAGHDGQKLVEFALKLLTQRKFFGKLIRIQDRAWAVEFLADRGWGKPVQQQEISLTRTQFVFHDEGEAVPPAPSVSMGDVLPAGLPEGDEGDGSP